MVVAHRAQLDYNVLDNGLISSTALAALMAPSAIPPPVANLNAIGCTVSSDIVINPGGFPATITRRLTVLFKNGEATATATRDQSEGAGPITSLTLTGNGSTYGRPPIVQITDSTVTPVRNALAHATLNVDAVNVLTGGAFYTSPVVTLVGGLAPGGVAATAHAVVAGGVITMIVVDAAGGPYEYPPLVVITDGFGSGATAIADLQVGALKLDDPGTGYVTPVVNIIDFFQYVWPTGISDQRQPFFNLMTAAIKRAIAAPVTAVAPVLQV